MHFDIFPSEAVFQPGDKGPDGQPVEFFWRIIADNQQTWCVSEGYTNADSNGEEHAVRSILAFRHAMLLKRPDIHFVNPDGSVRETRP